VVNAREFTDAGEAMSNGGGEPRIWILEGAKAGDFAQMHALARGLGWPFEVRQLRFGRFELLLHACPRPTLLAVDRKRSDALRPPWPDLVLTAGRRNELPARWISVQSKRAARIVHVGRPWSHPRHFDLVISNRQYALATADNVVVNTLPLVDPPGHAAPAAAVERFAVWPRPWSVVLVGGDSGPWVWTERRRRTFVSALFRLRARYGGSLLISTSARTPVALIDDLQHHFGATDFLYDYRLAADNPYRMLLQIADRFMVTADSLSMLSEALATGREVMIHDHLVGERRRFDLSSLRWKPLVHALTLSVGPRRMRRDARALHHMLRTRGVLKTLDDEVTETTSGTDVHGEDMARAVTAIRALLAR
jgi:mitochondrial fission protein ELM1